MLKLLLKIRLQYLWASMFKTSKNKKKRSPIVAVLLGLLAVYIIASIFLSLGMFFNSIIKPLIEIDYTWLYFSLAGLSSFVLGFIGSVFITQKEIFDAKDNDLLLSMPIPPSYILASRLLMIIVLNAVYSLLILLPAGVVYCIHGSVSIFGVVAFIIISLLLPLLITAVNCLFGWIIALIGSKIGRKNLFSTILMFALFLGYMYFYMNISEYINKLISNGKEIGDAIRQAIPFIYYFGSSVAKENLLHLLLFALWSIIPFALTAALISKFFIKITTAKTSAPKIKYKGGEMKVNSINTALLKKELKRFFTLPIYIFNSGFGAVLQLILPFVIIVKGSELIKQLTGVADAENLLAVGICAGMCFCALMTSTTSPSLSLEGKSFPILKSLPIEGREIFITKVKANMVITLPPMLISAIIYQFIVPMDLYMRVMIFALPISVQLFTALFGMCANMLYPRFEWINETVVVKQSASVMISVFGGMAIMALPIILYFVLLSDLILVQTYLLICMIFFIVLSLILYIFINKKGNALYNKM